MYISLQVSARDYSRVSYVDAADTTVPCMGIHFSGGAATSFVQIYDRVEEVEKMILCIASDVVRRLPDPMQRLEFVSALQMSVASAFDDSLSNDTTPEVATQDAREPEQDGKAVSE